MSGTCRCTLSCFVFRPILFGGHSASPPSKLNVSSAFDDFWVCHPMPSVAPVPDDVASCEPNSHVRWNVIVPVDDAYTTEQNMQGSDFNLCH